MEPCNCSTAATVDKLDQQLSLLTGVILSLLVVVIVNFAVAGCKHLQQNYRSRCLPPLLKRPAKESCKSRGELVVHRRSTSRYMYVKTAHLSRELINCTYHAAITSTPVQTVSTDKGELVAS